ncbi:MAG: helix-turn-helix domain-containing protein, partial [Chloroflexota bacterium]
MQREEQDRETIDSFGAWVQGKREHLGLTRNRLASLVGCSPVTIKKIERDERRPSRQIAELLAEHLQVEEPDVDRFIRRARGEFVPPRASGSPTPIKPQEIIIPNNLPQQITPFIGRERAVIQLIELINDPAKRLISIIGAGGMGKTRLALEVAERVLQENRFINGVYLIHLASHSDPTHIIPAIADSMGFSIGRERRSP